ncbi:hypothetical protein [Metabacillus iocasae]|uniref:Thiosulfate dehydrogenase [quinone] large subunit n=1 Tax=Priestia iocasae TaxID=2291674 RepID=A0ABS2QXG4_9BACI|nr:hypothetical protein [Metabacillus iocasae]MBM7704166.1 thiosulfate dehydrogenase [quinone] large subunit [Metabacillus iocasae]
MKINNVKLFSSLIVLTRILFGIGWLLAGITKITEKLWFKEPGIFLREYLTHSLQQPNVPLLYKMFIENIALEHVLVLNYAIPIVQILLGLFLIVGLFSIPAIFVCLFMHINFILSGNINVISLILYTNAFLLIIFRTNIYHFSLDKHFNLISLFTIQITKKETIVSLQPKQKKLLNNS